MALPIVRKVKPTGVNPDWQLWFDGSNLLLVGFLFVAVPPAGNTDDMERVSAICGVSRVLTKPFYVIFAFLDQRCAGIRHMYN